MPNLPIRCWPVVLVLLAIVMAGCGDDGATPVEPADPTGADNGDGDDVGDGDGDGDELDRPPETKAPTSTSVPDEVVASVSWWPVDPRESATIERWTVEVVARIDHDVEAFTQGLEVVDGVGYESTGRRGESSIRRFDPDTGEVLERVDLDPDHFGEGLTIVDDSVVQLTWQAGVALRWDRASLSPGEPSSYSGEGWGLCAGPDELVLSDGTDQVRIVDPVSFEVERTVDVVLDGEAVSLLNELECVDELVVANVWKTDQLVVFDPVTGAIVAVIDATSIADEVGSESGGEVDILNGVAALDDGTFLLSGKLWPTTFRVRLIPT